MNLRGLIISSDELKTLGCAPVFGGSGSVADSEVDTRLVASLVRRELPLSIARDGAIHVLCVSHPFSVRTVTVYHVGHGPELYFAIPFEGRLEEGQEPGTGLAAAIVD